MHIQKCCSYFLCSYFFFLSEQHMKNMTLLIYSVLFHALAEQIILSRKRASSAHRSVPAAQEQSRQQQRGWEGLVSANSSKGAPDAALETHAQFGVTWAIWRVSLSCQRISTGCQQEKCNAGNDGLGKALIMREFSCHTGWGPWQNGKVMEWGQDHIHGKLYWAAHRAHTLSLLMCHEMAHKWDMNWPQLG